MKITGIRVYQVDLPLHEGRYQWSGGKSVDVFDTTVVEVLTDAGGLTGIGEVCPLGPVYLPAFAGGARAGIAEIAPHLIGLDPRQPAVVYQAMERALKGHPYAKSALDMACWDLLGKASDQPLCNLLGGRFGENHVLYRAISQEEPETMARKVAAYREEGYRRFQLKVGGEPDEDIQRIRAVSALMRPGDILVADANTGWLMKDAMRVVRAVRDLDVFIEQPCATYEECLSVRRRTDHPFVLDESIDDLPELVRAINDQAMDVINIKISKLGGISRAREVRDVCLRSGIAMTIEDTWGGDVVTAAISHLAHSTPTAFLFTSTDFNSYVTVDIADGAPRRRRGRLAAPTAPGLGVTLKHDVLGDPVAVHGHDARS